MTPPHLRGRLRAIVVPREGRTDAAAAELRTVSVPDLDVEVVIADNDVGVDALNRAATVDRVDYLAFVSADRPVPASFLADCVAQLRADLSTGAVGWSPRGQEAGAVELFVPTEAVVARHSAFHAVAGFDATRSGGLHGLDLGWRMWLAGYRVRSVGPSPHPVPVHDPEGAAASLRDGLAAYLEPGSFTGPWETPEGNRVRRAAAGHRYRIQPGRRRGDGELLPLAHAAVRGWADHEPSASALREVLERWGAPERAGTRRRIAVVTSDTLAVRMAGPAIRAVQIARRLALEHDVVLATTGVCDLSLPGVEVRQVGEKGLTELDAWCDILLFQGWVLHGRPHLVASPKIVVVDIYDPMHLEQLEQAHDAPGERGRYETVAATTDVLNVQLLRADFLLCASAKQRDLWLGQLAGLGRVNPVTYDGDEALQRLLAIVPFGVGDEPPVQTRSAIRGAIPGIGVDDKVILWGGGVYNWFDPITLVRAIDRLKARIPEIRLLFLGMKHPNPGVPQMRVAFETQQLARELGIEGTHVFFNSEWVEFDDRHNYLLDADIGVSTHLDHIETEFSFRTRILDYLWAELPIVATDGDSFAAVIEREELGLIVPPRDVDALEQALERLLTEPDLVARCKERIRSVAPALRWGASLEPLVEFCRAPRRAADVACPELDLGVIRRRQVSGRRRDIEIAISYLRAGAPRIVLDRVRKRIRSART